MAKAAKKITARLDVLLAFYDYPAEHWIRLWTTNPTTSTFAHLPAQDPDLRRPREPSPRGSRGPSN